jgi:hypothetical protein
MKNYTVDDEAALISIHRILYNRQDFATRVAGSK